MTEQPTTDLKELFRIYQNTYFLLVEGAFSGKYAQGLLEAQKFTAEIMEKLEKDMKANDDAKEAGSGNRDQESGGRVGSDSVPDQGRQDPQGNAN